MNRLKNFIVCFLLFTIFFIASVSAAAVHTDKESYEFGETVLINSSGFLANDEIGIQINNQNNVQILINQTTADGNGNFTVIFLTPTKSDSTFMTEGTYSIYVSSRSTSAQTTFNLTMVNDTTPPTFSGNQTNETKAGNPCEFSLAWDDNKALNPYGQYIFSTNNSGRWTNSTLINFTSKPQTVSNVTTLNNTETRILWKYYASDNANNWVVSDTYEVYTVTTVPCDLRSVNVNPICSEGDSSDCEPLEKLTVNATYSGDCPDPAYIQVNANGTGCYICDQDRDICDDNLCNITGITIRCSDSPCLVNWTIPSTIPSVCQGKTMNTTYSSLNSKFPCRAGNVKKDEVTPTGLFVFYLTTTSTTSTTTTTVVITTSLETTTVQMTTYYHVTTTTIPSKEGSSSTYWIIAIVVIMAIVGVFIWFKYFRRTEESSFERLKQKWSR